MDSTQIASELESVSSAKLSLEISHLVARALAGEPIDMAAEGAALAARYADLGMSGEMIGNAVDRAVGMVGAIRNGAAAAAPPSPDAEPSGREELAVVGLAQSEDDDGLPQNAGAEIAELIGQSDESILLHTESGREPAAQAEFYAARTLILPPRQSSSVVRFARGPVAAVRRAFFRN